MGSTYHNGQFTLLAPVPLAGAGDIFSSSVAAIESFIPLRTPPRLLGFFTALCLSTDSVFFAQPLASIRTQRTRVSNRAGLQLRDRCLHRVGGADATSRTLTCFRTTETGGTKALHSCCLKAQMAEKGSRRNSTPFAGMMAATKLCLNQCSASWWLSACWTGYGRWRRRVERRGLRT